MTRAIMFAAAAVVAVNALVLYLLPRPRSAPEAQCAESSAQPDGGSSECRLPQPGAPDTGPAEPPLPGVDGPLPAPHADPKLYVRLGLAALRQHWFAVAFRRCSAAVKVQGPHRREALLCEGRAALKLGWPMRAGLDAARALALGEDAEAYVLLGQAHLAQKNCKDARRVFLIAADLEPGNTDAAEGLRACAVDQPPDMRTDSREYRMRIAELLLRPRGALQVSKVGHPQRWREGM